MNLDDPGQLVALVSSIGLPLLIVIAYLRLLIGRLERRVDSLESHLGVYRWDKHREPRRPRQRRQPIVDTPDGGS